MRLSEEWLKPHAENHEEGFPITESHTFFFLSAKSKYQSVFETHKIENEDGRKNNENKILLHYKKIEATEN